VPPKKKKRRRRTQTTTNTGKDTGKREGYREKGILIYSWWEYKLVQPLWKSVKRFLEKLKIELLYDTAIPLLNIYLKECKDTIKTLAHSCLLQYSQ
jgi:hypothetical protein